MTTSNTTWRYFTNYHKYIICRLPVVFCTLFANFSPSKFLQHNPDLCINNEGEFERFYLCVKNMADIVVPQEYGISEESKIGIAQRVCTPLLSKIRNDLHHCVKNNGSQDAANNEESLTRLDPRLSIIFVPIISPKCPTITGLM
jgi:hypothetical protein